jgi:transposase
LELRLKCQTRRVTLLKQQIRKLTSDKNALNKEVASHKWKHILSKQENTRLKRKLEVSEKKNSELQQALKIARLPQNSSNSSRSPSTDLFKPMRKQYSLRKKTGRKTGGQPGHAGSTLAFCTDPPDRLIEHSVQSCAACGADLTDVPGKEEQTHQVIDVHIPKQMTINHTTFTKYCSCGHFNTANFPPGAKGMVNYGNNLRGLIANLSVRQYMPYKRTVEFIQDICGIHISQGTVANLLGQIESSANKQYRDIQQKISMAPVVGADETSVKINGAQNWFHTYQTPELTFIGFHPSRGKRAQQYFYPQGLPCSILVTDCLAMQLATPAAAHQVCLAHLLREINAFEEAYPQQVWPTNMKTLFQKAIDIRGKPANAEKIKTIERKFKRFINTDQSNAPGKIPAFWKRMNIHQDKIFTFLSYPKVPSDNNGSERSIRNVKVKQKVSGQFKTRKGAHTYAIIRSIIDTCIKQNKNVHNELARIASLHPE